MTGQRMTDQEITNMSVNPEQQCAAQERALSISPDNVFRPGHTSVFALLATISSEPTRFAGLGDVDEEQLVAELEVASVSYRAALATTAKVLQPSLLELLS